MNPVKVSTKFQIIIPLELRSALGIRAGEKMLVFGYENRIELIPVAKLNEKRGFLRGIGTTVQREKNRH